MATSQPLTTESFSYNWLLNRRPSFGLCSDDDDEEEEEETSYIVKSKRFLEEAQNFSFDFPISNSSPTTDLVHADEIFFDGHIMPKYMTRKNSASLINTSISAPATPSFPSLSSKHRKTCCHFLRKWRKSSKMVLQKCFRLFVPQKNIRVGDIDMSKRIDIYSTRQKAKSWSNSPQESPLCVPSYSYSDAVYEAVLHCKRSIEK